MNKEFDKIIEKLENELKLADEEKLRCARENPLQFDSAKGYANGVANSIEIVKQEAEQYNNGWIPCSERLPDNDKKEYIVQKTNGFIYILGFTKDAYKLSRYDFAEYKGKKKQLFYDYDSEYGYTEWECEAWRPLPEPFKERD